jgi:DNA helicase II / ATP-dependent DNA helicase PcrA
VSDSKFSNGFAADIAALGRGVVVSGGTVIPDPWSHLEPIRISESDVVRPCERALLLRRKWLTREPVVVVLNAGAAVLKVAETWTIEPYELNALTTPWRDLLFHFVYCNNFVMRADGSLVWPWVPPARTAGATPVMPESPGDVILATGQAVWIDGGPRETAPAIGSGLPIVSWESVENGRLDVVLAPVTVKAELAPDQERAVAHVGGAARIIAPAGSGKTRVLTTRLRRLIKGRRYDRSNTIAVAYNKRAQLEMESRCSDFKPRIKTLHSLGLEIVTAARGPVRTIDETETRAILDTIVTDRTFQLNTDTLRPYIDGLSAVRHRLESPQTVEDTSGEITDFDRVFSLFRGHLCDRGLVDFDEHIYAAVDFLLRDGRLRRTWQRHCRHMLVDEFQDLNPAQLLLVRLLSAPLFDVFGVGDDDQVLYGYDGANPDFLVNFGKYFPNPAHYQLEVNYRCPPDIVSSAGNLLKLNRLRVKKDVRPADAVTKAEPGLVIHEEEGSVMLAAAIDHIRDWVRGGVSPADIAVLCRVNALLLGPQIALVEANVPINSTLGPWLLDRTVVRVALAYLRLSSDPNRMAAADLDLIYRRPYRGIRREFPQLLTTSRHWTLKDLDSVGAKAAGGPKVRELIDDLELLNSRASQGTAAMLACVRQEIGLAAVASSLDEGKLGQFEPHSDELMALEQVAALHPTMTTFESWLRKGLTHRGSSDGVVLATVHKVKGQEWNYVAVYGVSEGQFPHRLCLEDVEGERRVMHVAITRARRHALLLVDKSRPSRFVGELLGQMPPVENRAVPRTKTPTGERRSRSGSGWLSPKMGDRVRAGGLSGEVIGRTDRGIQISLGSQSSLLVRWGDRISLDGVSGRLVADSSY